MLEKKIFSISIETLRPPLLILTATALPLFLYAPAQDRVSKPGVYSGYSRMLYTEAVPNSQYITMRDGIKLAATIYRPAVSGKAVGTPYPVIWEGTTSRGRRNPNGTVRLLSSTPRAPGQSRLSVIDIVKFGYVLVQVERRGQGASMGFMRGYHDWTESLDAYDITEWLAHQSWSSGKIGVFGCSNTGEAALHAPTAMPPHLKAVFAGCYSWNKFDGFFRGSILATWGTGPQTSPISAGLTAVPVDEDVDESMLKEAIRQHEKQISLLGLWKSMPFRDSYRVNYDVTCSSPVAWGQTCVLDDKGITNTSKPLTTDRELTGHPVVHLWISSTAGDANFFVYLEDIAPDGRVSIITDGRLKGSLRTLGTPSYSVFGLPWHRSYQEDAVAFTSGKPEEVVFDCLPLSYVFTSGHRIRITITGADPREKDRVQLSPPPTIIIHRDAVHSSFIVLPVIQTDK